VGPSSCTPARPSETRGFACSASPRWRRGARRSSGSRSASRRSSLSGVPSSCATRAGERRSRAAGASTSVPPGGPARAGTGRVGVERLRAGMEVGGASLARRLLSERGGVPAADLLPLTGVPAEAVATADGVAAEGGWLLAQEFVEAFGEVLREALRTHHAAHPLQPGLESGEARALLARSDPRLQDASLAQAMISHLA